MSLNGVRKQKVLLLLVAAEGRRWTVCLWKLQSIMQRGQLRELLGMQECL